MQYEFYGFSLEFLSFYNIHNKFTCTSLICKMITSWKAESGLITSVLHSGSRSLNSSPGSDHCVMCLGKTVSSQPHMAFINSGVKIDAKN